MPGGETLKELHLSSLQKKFGCYLVAVEGPLWEEETRQ